MTTVLVLIDLQNDYFPGGAMELVNADPAVAQAARLLDAFRQRSLPVVHIQHVANHEGATFFLPGTPGTDLHPSVMPRAGEQLVTKHHPSGFRETTLLEKLHALGASRLVFAGMMTHMCVDTTVRAAADLGFACSLAQDACATTDLTWAGQTVPAAGVQAAYLAALDGTFADVRTAQELVAGL